MKCPVCQEQLLPVGDHTAYGSKSFPSIGYNCPTQSVLPHNVITSHYTVRGTNTIITAYPYRLSIWAQTNHPSQGSTSILQYSEETKKFEYVTSLPILFELDSEEKLRQRLSILVTFS
jgi:hypothetical protein